MSIQENIKRVKKQMLMEVGETKAPVSGDVQRLALRAIKDGQGSGAWGEYMGLFVEANNSAQLGRLMATDGTDGDKELNNRRAYLVADGTCGTDTVTNFGKNASEMLDLGLEEEPAPEG